LSYWIVHALLELLLKLPQFGPHALADRFASHGEAPQTIPPANMQAATLKRAFGDHYVYAGLGTTLTMAPHPQQEAEAH
jgi:hypothetical protein